MTTLRDRPHCITRIADDHGLQRAEVRTLIRLERVRTYRVGHARFVEAEDWPRLAEVVRRYCEAGPAPVSP